MEYNEKKLDCPVEIVLKMIGNKWKILIIRNLLSGTWRFNALVKSLKISPRVLTTNLKELEDSGLIIRKVFAEVPPRVEYNLSTKGKSLKPVLDAMAAWGTAYKQNKL